MPENLRENIKENVREHVPGQTPRDPRHPQENVPPQHARTEQVRTEQPRTEQPRTEQPRTEQPRTEQPQAEQPRAEQPRTDDTRRDERRGAPVLNEEWQAVQYEFVDDPQAAVRRADELVTRALEDFTSRQRSLAQQLARKSGDGTAQTEDLRLALHKYRELFQSLVTVK